MTLLPLPLRCPAARLAGVAATLLLFAAPALVAQRLPTNVRPEHYTLHLTPDLDKATFSGEETIDVMLAQPADSITLNALEIQFQSATASGGRHELKADV
ncbi:MAG TPA: M1 family peptidase, partial [Acidobacteriaceae bacterium]|nr:M1 family peptidase [Acidobacteriaceae bacterium]